MPELRWRFKACLETLTPLRIGDGGVNDQRLDEGEDGVKPDVATVFLDHNSRPYLPATSLKGWLRSFAEGVLNETEVTSLFGSKRTSLELNGGRMRLFDGSHKADPLAEKLAAGQGVYWGDGKRHTCVASHVVIDRDTGAAAQKLLFFEEYLPAGMTFDLEFELRSADQNLAAAFFYLLRQFDLEGGGPARLGASSAEDWGRVRITAIKAESIDQHDLKRWLRGDGLNAVPFRTDQTEVLLNLLEQRPSVKVRPRLEYKLTVRFNGAFVSNDSWRARKRRDPESKEEGNLTPLRLPGPSGPVPYLPNSSLHGALRSRAEKILRTMGVETPAPSDKDALPIVRCDSDLTQLDPVSLWFGAPGWRSPIRLYEQQVIVPGEKVGQELIAIDRFTGGGAASRKFKACYFWKSTIEVMLSIDPDAIAFAFSKDLPKCGDAWLLLALTLRDFADGFVTLGAGAAKGFGACSVQVEPIAVGGLPENLPAAIRKSLEGGFAPREWPVAGNPTGDETPMAPAVAPGQREFFNPYHFCPVKPPDPTGLPTLGELSSSALSLDRYHPGLDTGYFDCTLTAETPLFVGAEQDKKEQGEKKQPNEVTHYKRDGKLAIPASTLRGLLSSEFETLTNSCMRVLDNSYYSVRKSLREPPTILSALGLAVKRQVDGKACWFLRPLTLPTFRPAPPLDPVWRTIFPVPVMKQYVNMPGGANWRPGQPPTPRSVPGPLSWNASFTDVVPLAAIHSKNDFRLSLAAGGATPVQGIWRTLGNSGNRQIPPTKKHELFIPAPFLAGFPVESETAPEPDLIPLPMGVVKRFERLAAQMTEQWKAPDGDDIRPYEPVGTRPSRHAGDTAKNLCIEPGDVVYFGLEKKPTLHISEISFSAVWRKEVPLRTFDFFAAISPDLLPMSDVRLRSRIDRLATPVTLAEKLFGFVEMREGEECPCGEKVKAEKSDIPLAALAGRLRFTDAVYTGNKEIDPQFTTDCTLKILSSPKPPSPAMYFFNEGAANSKEQYVSKTALGHDCHHRPKGRKFYLHHAVPQQRHTGEDAPWRTHTPLKVMLKGLR